MWGPSSLPKNRSRAPSHFSAHFYCGQTAECIKMPLGMEVALSPGDFGPRPSPKRGRSPQFSAQVYCGQTTAWITMSLGTEVGLSPDDIVLDGDTALPPQKGDGAPLPNFRSMSIVAKRPDGSRWHLAWRWALVKPHCDLALPLKGHSPQFSANVSCGQTAGWTKMLLGMEIGLGPCDCLVGTQIPAQKRAQSPTQFWPMSIVAKRLDG